MDAENIRNDGCSQRDSAEHKGHVRAHRSFNRIWKERDSAQPDLLEKILDRDNLNRAFKRVKANKGAPGVDGMTIDETLQWLKDHNRELTDRIRRGKYTPKPVRRVEIPKPDGGVRKLGIPTVTDRIIQQAMAQQMIPIFEPLFSDGSFGYRPGRSAKDAILKVKEYTEQGYTHAVSLDLSKYFDTMNHTILVNLLRKEIKDERVIQMVKRYLRSGVMENGVVVDTEEGSPQGGKPFSIAGECLPQRIRPGVSETGSTVCTLCGRHRPAGKERTSRKETTGNEHEIPRGNPEIKGEPREKPRRKCVCNQKF